MKNITAIFKKQIKDTFKNKTILIQFLMFPILTLIMNSSIKIDGMPENFFITLFATMYIGMAPLTSMAAIVSEEKERKTLRVLLMSNVKPYEFLLGIGSYVWAACMAGAVIICAGGSYNLQERIIFLIIMAIGIFISLLIGSAIGIWCKCQMSATEATVLVMMIFSFMPMLSMFNTSVEKIAKFLFSQQISILLSQVKLLQPEITDMVILITNILVYLLLFTFTYKKYGLE